MIRSIQMRNLILESRKIFVWDGGGFSCVLESKVRKAA